MLICASDLQSRSLAPPRRGPRAWATRRSRACSSNRSSGAALLLELLLLPELSLLGAGVAHRVRSPRSFLAAPPVRREM